MLFRRKIQILIACLCFLLAFSITLQYKSVTKNSSVVLTEVKRTQELENQLINANAEVINLKKENMQLLVENIVRNDKVIVRVPATSANLGSGFDCTGIAFKKYNVFSFEKNERTSRFDFVGFGFVYSNSISIFG